LFLGQIIEPSIILSIKVQYLYNLSPSIVFTILSIPATNHIFDQINDSSPYLTFFVWLLLSIYHGNYNLIEESMGQQCCSVQEGAPEVLISNEEYADETVGHRDIDQHSSREIAEKNQKETFYGKDGHKYSKTITREMASQIDEDIDQYKSKIFAKQSTIK
jgi:hypothetical protein